MSNLLLWSVDLLVLGDAVLWIDHGAVATRMGWLGFVLDSGFAVRVQVVARAREGGDGSPTQAVLERAAHRLDRPLGERAVGRDVDLLHAVVTDELLADLGELLAVERDAAARSPQGERWSNDGWETQFGLRRIRIFH